MADLIPHLNLVGLLLRKDHKTFTILLTLEEDVDLVTDLEIPRPLLKLAEGDQTLRLVADIH
jgi:hypothetical protein